jgi:DNA-binding transcriptional LysR family regulator
MKQGFDWNDLPFFLELSRHGRLAPVARRLRVDNATVSRRIAELERALERKLFERTAGGFVLSEAGNSLLRHAEAIEANITEIEETIATKDKAALAGSVRLATMEGFASAYLAKRLAGLHHDQPDLLIELMTSKPPPNLTKREADICVSFVKPQGSRLAIERIGTVQLRLYASADYVRRRGEPLVPSDLAHHVFVDYIDDLVTADNPQWLGEIVENPIVTFRSNCLIAQQNAVAAGLGVGILPYFLAESDKRLTPLLEDSLSITRELWLSVHEDCRHIGRIRAVMGFIRQTVLADADYLNGRFG